MKYGQWAWIVVNRRGGSAAVRLCAEPSISTPGYRYDVFATRKTAKAAAGKNQDVVKVYLEYEWEWLPKE